METCPECARMQLGIDEAEETRRQLRHMMDATLRVEEHARIAEKYTRTTEAVRLSRAALEAHKATHQKQVPDTPIV